MTDPQRILIVEDDASVRRTLTIFLEKAGFDVVAVAEFQRALELIRGELFDTLVTDLDLPGGTGLDLVHTVKALHPAMRSVLITGFGCSAFRQLANELALHGYLEKPFDPDDLVARLKED